ncbi:RsmF rRNA methyltransferase first C-terminal domain-containing protein [Apilactobacillus timberlakei]|uniref:NOL1/NOP2/sun family putative RNA methylase n=1 Tax=Apilactobacillus timberlakei TaxID=2008380 RepID=A0ABY2YTN1_9LACO|nr:RsmF rRNA methyltransferase first C-terminal domain-containing protein [Apilactobacillus timberlakei]TPR13956.1 NOL1/NOP2/sun family putative RNA methylase [Apilactobacillus timberlakei]TPR15272.1 NOL1/NOP2/sun family putative RNA methylase [Apilactobacillus timberlakei]TPR16803.1 NOL1/NOP2/sun family putative RNA methylase [Apilactobacillus timberlakei]TPR17163.1 NOL1/NOP2/sun family putative RNA methylase [Apilactobacillus timberlakei]TPR20175.1 NOL1/NOP2/sun family putative RNA methylase
MQLPLDFKKKYKKLLGNDAESFFNSLESSTNPGFRINPLKENLPENEDLTHPIEYCQYGYYGEINGKSVDHQSGAIYSQEPSAMYVGEVADVHPGEKILDLCAAPGGKTTHIASYMKNEGILVTNEIDYKRAKILAENVERFGIQNAIVLNENPNNLAKHFPKFFDTILIDAPCSGEGMFRKNPDATKYWNLEYPIECAKRQKDILKQAIKMLKPGGKIVYSTCTFAPEEDEQIVSWMINNFDLNIEPIKKYSGMSYGHPEWSDGNEELKSTVRLFPNKFKGEGHFIAKLVNSEKGNPKKIKKLLKGNLSSEQSKLWKQFINQNMTNFVPKNLITFGEQLYSFEKGLPELEGLKVMRPGLHLGTFKKKRFEPSYALALSIHKDLFNKKLNVSKEEWEDYVHGDTISCDKSLEKGWYLLICDDQPFAFGKVVNGIVKNFMPKGLRFKV